MRLSWSVIIKTKYSREIHNFKDKNEAEEFYKKVKEENKRKKVSLINTKDIKPPDENKKKKKAGQLWCPLCHEYRTFEKNSILGLRVCSWCGISEEFYYIKKYNNLWK